MTEGRLAEPPGQGTPCRVPGSPRSTTLLDVLLSLEGQTALKSDETRTIATVSKRPSQWQKNRVDMMSALQEKPRKLKETGRNDKPTEQDDPPEPPPEGLGHGRSVNDRPHWQNARGSASRTPRAGNPPQGPRFAPFYDTTRRFAQFGGSNDLQI